MTSKQRQMVAAMINTRVVVEGWRAPKYRNSNARNGTNSTVLPYARTSLYRKSEGSVIP
jgi:hypothetical protein